MNHNQSSKLTVSTIISGIGATLFGGIMVSVFGGDFVTGAVYGGLVGVAGRVTSRSQRTTLSGAVFGGAVGVAHGLLSDDLGEAIIATIAGVALGALLGAGFGWLLDLARVHIRQDA